MFVCSECDISFITYAENIFDAEYRADKQAVMEGYGEAMIIALKKLAKENFAELAPTRISVLLEYSHPPLADRISAVERLIKDKESLK